MTKFNRRIYARDHRLAKSILVGLQLILTILITFVFISNQLVYILPIVVVKELCYYYGVNTVAYVIESIRGHRHIHTKV